MVSTKQHQGSAGVKINESDAIVAAQRLGAKLYLPEEWLTVAQRTRPEFPGQSAFSRSGSWR